MLARFAAALQRGQIQTIAGRQAFGDGGGTIVVDDNCLVSLFNLPQTRWRFACALYGLFATCLEGLRRMARLLFLSVAARC